MSDVPSKPGVYEVTWPNGWKRVVLLDRKRIAVWLYEDGSQGSSLAADFNSSATWQPLSPQAEAQFVEAGKVQGVGVLHLVDDEGEIRFFRVEDARAAEAVIDGLIAVRRLSDRLEALEDAELGDVIRWATGEDKLVVIRPRDSNDTPYPSKPIVEEPVAPEPDPAVAEPVEPWTTERPSESGNHAILWPDGRVGDALVVNVAGGTLSVLFINSRGGLGWADADSTAFAGCRFRRLTLPVAPEPEFESCPWCVASDCQGMFSGVTDKFYVVCECGARGPTGDNRAKARHAWNKRA